MVLSLLQRLQALTEEAWEQAGEQFNLDSTKQLQPYFYDKLNLPVLKKPLVASLHSRAGVGRPCPRL
ncbi:MAG: hypothetical protein CM15mP68_7070 [Pseudomonadota bacterium]|nr:MAG: hypothetical protein CM15mP68_7070 [Pseudomonadota bacterium]